MFIKETAKFSKVSVGQGIAHG